MQFSELNLCDEIIRAINEQGFVEPTEIQTKSIPPIIEGKDVIGKSSTGTGKTAAFAIPVLEMCAKEAKKGCVLILSPTRELAVQTADEVRKFSKYIDAVSVATVYGGASMENQIRSLKTAKIVIGTPGRIMDHLRRKTLKLDNLKVLVLDEADEMLNMGFIDDIRTILETAPEDRQTVLFSATMPKAILEITNEFQKDPELVEVKSTQRTAENIVQTYYNIPQAGKNDALKLLIEYHKPMRSLVFCNTKKMVDELVETLCSAGFKAVGIHGDLKQSQRQIVMKEFKSGRAKILVATDVAARGIDVEDVEAVFNYDIPKEYEYYIHRIGRTARAGKKGASFTLVANRSQFNLLKDIERYVHTTIEERPVPSLETIAQKRVDSFLCDIRESIKDGIDDGWRSLINDLVDEGYDPIDIATVLCSQKQLKNKRLVNVCNVASLGNKKQNYSSNGHVWVRVSIGSDAKIGPNFIVGAVVEGTGLPKTAIGKINIFPEYTDIEFSQEDAMVVLSEMKGSKIKGKPVEFSLVSSNQRSRGHFEDRSPKNRGNKSYHENRRSGKGRSQNNKYSHQRHK